MKTQKEIVQTALLKKEKTIKELHSETGILRPNIRRILGQGAKKGEFKRLARGVYTLTTESGEERAYIYSADAIKTVPILADKGYKADMIFLDIPYKTPAVIGGNRGVKYDTITPGQFWILIQAIKKIVRTPDSPVVYMFSVAKSGNKHMSQYNKMLWLNGFKKVADGDYYKYNEDKITRCKNMIGEIIEPEHITVYNLSGKKLNAELEFHLIRPKGYQTEKPIKLVESIIAQTTKSEDMVHDYFAGSGVVGDVALKLNRRCLMIDIHSVENWILPRLNKNHNNLFIQG